MSDELEIIVTALKHESGTKAYRVISARNVKTNMGVQITNWGKTGFVGQVKIDSIERLWGSYLVILHREAVERKHKRGYDNETVMRTPEDSISEISRWMDRNCHPDVMSALAKLVSGSDINKESEMSLKRPSPPPLSTQPLPGWGDW